MIIPSFLTYPKPIILENDQLLVEIDQPGIWYRGSRFDWTGFVRQVSLKRRGCPVHTFCAPETLQGDPSRSGSGLCNEFGIDTAIGYASARPGEVFPKLGVGLLVREDDQPYNFSTQYEIAQLFAVDCCREDTFAIFTSMPLNCRGYSAKLQKTLRVRNNQLLIDYSLENTGSNPLVTEEYCHNFIAIDFDHGDHPEGRFPIGPEYSLLFPYQVDFEKTTSNTRKSGPSPRHLLTSLFPTANNNDYAKYKGPLLLDKDRISLRSQPVEQFYCRLTGSSQTRLPQFQLLHRATGVGMSETDSFPPLRVAVWGTTHVMSTEVFQRIELMPGEFQVWSRHFTFFSGASS
jgi:hypothetical protein